MTPIQIWKIYALLTCIITSVIAIVLISRPLIELTLFGISGGLWVALAIEMLDWANEDDDE